MPALQVVGGKYIPESQEIVGKPRLENISLETRKLREDASTSVVQALSNIPPEGTNKTSAILELLVKHSKNTNQDIRNRNTDGKHTDSIRGDKGYELIYPDSPLKPLLSALDETTLKDFLNSAALGELHYFFNGNQSQRLEDEIRVIIENKFGKKNKKFADIFIIGIQKGIIRGTNSISLYYWNESGIPTKEVQNFLDFYTKESKS